MTNKNVKLFFSPPFFKGGLRGILSLSLRAESPLKLGGDEARQSRYSFYLT